MFFRKNKNETQAKDDAQQVDKVLLLEEAEKAKAALNNLTGESRIAAINKLGSLYFQAGSNDDAIQYYELSLAENKTLGKAYTDLMKLYNVKRREAAENKDEEAAKLYLGKINSLMQLSKDIIRGKE